MFDVSRQFSGAVFDSRLVKPGMVFVALKGDGLDGRDFIDDALKRGAVGVIEGYDELNAAAKEYRRSLAAKVIGVTGSAGKTTTKEFLRAFLSAAGRTFATEGNYNNHIGVPITILNCPRDAEFLVVEMGSNHPGEIASLCEIALPDAGVVTNVGTAHLEFFKTRDGIKLEKGELLRRSKKGYSSKYCQYLPGEVDTRQRWIEEALQKVLPGKHNAANAALAYAVAADFGVSRESALKALDGFVLPGSRWRRFTINQVDYIDDTYNANPDAMIAALDAFAAEPCDGKHVAVLGDMFELGENSLELHRKVFSHAMSLGIELVIGVGEMSSQCICHLAYKEIGRLKSKFRFDVSAGDLVLLKASHSMKLGALVE